jgi:hypothetical protein
MRVIPSGRTVCSHREKQNCIAVFWEERDDWEDIVDAASKVRNVGKKGVGMRELKEGLLPEERYRWRWV